MSLLITFFAEPTDSVPGTGVHRKPQPIPRDRSTWQKDNAGYCAAGGTTAAFIRPPNGRPSYCVVVALVAAVVSLCSGWDAGAMESRRIVTVKERVVCKKDVLRMSDLIMDNRVLTEQERGLEIMPLANDGEPQTLSLIDLAYQLQRFPELANVYLRGPDRVHIMNHNNKEFLEHVRRAVLVYLQDRSPWSDWTIDVHLSKDDERAIYRMIPFRTLTIKTLDHNRSLGSVPFRVSFERPNQVDAEHITITPEVVRETRTVVASRSMDRGDILSSEDVSVSMAWVNSERSSTVDEVNDCIGRELKRSLKAGTRIRKRDLLDPIYARRGDMVWVNCRLGATTVQVSVAAMQTGRKGEFIRVRNPTSDKVFSVKLVGEKKGLLSIGG